MTKKFISITLSILLVFSLLVLPVSAEDLFDDTVELALGEKITFDFTDDVWEKYIKFVADKTMTVSVSSETADEKDPYCMVFDADGVDIASADDSDTGYDFICKFEVTEGETYYILVAVYDFETATTVVSLDCGHAYTDGICDDCGDECTHEVLNAFGVCDCGSVFGGIILEPGEVTVTYEGADLYYKFVPEEDGIYVVKSHADEDADPYCELYSAEGEFLDVADDSAEDYNFTLFYEFTAGEVYYFLIYDYNETAEWKMTLENAVHTTEDNEEHVLIIVEEFLGSCVEMSYSKGLYCPECDVYVAGHEELGYSFHFDFDEDDLCDYCGTEIVYEEYPETDFNEIFNLLIEFVRQLFSLYEELIKLGFGLFVDIIG